MTSAKLKDMGRSKDKPDDKKPGMIRVSASIARKLAVVALAHGQSIQEIIDPHLKPIVDRLYREAMKKLGQEESDGG